MVNARYDGGDLGLAAGLMFAIDVHLSDLQPGEILEVSSSNIGLIHELPAWCRGTGHPLVLIESDGDRTLFHIERGHQGSLMFADRPELPLGAPDRCDGFPTPDWLMGKLLTRKCSDPTNEPHSIKKIRITITTSTSGVMFGPES